VAEEGTQEVGFSLNGAGVAAADGGEVIDIWRGEVRERLGLEVAPDVFDGIKFGSVGREVKRERSGEVEEAPDLGSTMCLGAIPHESHRGVKMAGEVLHELWMGFGPRANPVNDACCPRISSSGFELKAS
jgi:hypothetical protein